jgi:hypothetical protein
MDIEAFSVDLQQRVISRCELEGDEAFRESAFTQIVIDFLSESGELDDAEACAHRAYGIQVNGYSISEYDERIDLIVSIHCDQAPPQTIPKDEVSAAFKRLRKFADKALSGYQFEVEESTPVFDLAQRIYQARTTVAAIRLILVTDGVVKGEPPKDVEDGDVSISHHVWDIERIYRCWSSGREREPIEVDFLTEYGELIPCLTQPVPNSQYSTYLAIFPGTILSALYGKHGPRLLERNVRSFLQARGKINAGIRRTILREPEMFLAYNNGLSCTAEAVSVEQAPGGGIGIRSLKDLQIVNGGQTTASVFHAQKKDKADVSGIFVQAKLTVLSDPARMDEVVPLVSKYANSQNKVQTADLEANSAYHRRVEELSRTIWAPARDGSQRQSHWYYERARGQYQDDVAREGTPARQRDFKTTSPQAQLFTKTDLAKFIYTWGAKPHIVSRGAQSCFSDFTVSLAQHVEEEKPVDQDYFERVVAKAILFREADNIIKGRYKGYKAQLVTYTLARIADQWRKTIDLGQIWREQSVPDPVKQTIAVVAEAAYRHITENSQGGNVTQYCKKEDCWKSFAQTEIPMPTGLLGMAKVPARISVGRTNASERSPLSGSDIQKAMAIAPDAWFRLGEWVSKSKGFTALDREIASSIALSIGYGKQPNPKMAKDGIRIIESARQQGFKG